MGKKKNKNQIKPVVVMGIIVIVIAVFAVLLNKNQKEMMSQDSSTQPETSFQKLVSPQLNKLSERYVLTLTYPDTWDVSNSNFIEREGKIYEYNIGLRKDSYEILITQGDMGITYCLFEYNPEYGSSKPNYVRFDNYKEITSTIGELRMASSNENIDKTNKLVYLICQREKDNNTKTWSTRTEIGNITVEIPVNYDPNVLNEINSIIENIQYQAK